MPEKADPVSAAAASYDDMRQGNLDEYDRAATAAHSWSNQIPQAIEHWYRCPDGYAAIDPEPNRTGKPARAAPEADPVSALRTLSEDASPDWTLTDDGTIAWMVREGPRGAQIGNFILREDAAFAVAAVEYVRAVLSGEAPDRDGEIERIAAVLTEVAIADDPDFPPEDRGTIVAIALPAGPADRLAAALYDAGLRAPSLEGARPTYTVVETLQSRDTPPSDLHLRGARHPEAGGQE